MVDFQVKYMMSTIRMRGKKMIEKAENPISKHLTKIHDELARTKILPDDLKECSTDQGALLKIETELLLLTARLLRVYKILDLQFPANIQELQEEEIKK